MDIVKVVATNLKETQSYLLANYQTSLFLLGNLDEFGPQRIEAKNSGNFYAIIENGVVRGVFCLANRGTLIFQLDKNEYVFNMLQHVRQHEDIVLNAMIGEFEKGMILTTLMPELQFEPSQEILYSYCPIADMLKPVVGGCYFPGDQFEAYYKELNTYFAETKMPFSENEESKKMFLQSFEFYIQKKRLWALMQDQKIIARAAINSAYLDIAQIGGVYTLADYRQKGYGRQVVQQLIHDAYHHAGVRRFILFTAVDNYPAQKVYENIGFQRVGYYGMFFVKKDPTNKNDSQI